MTDQAARYDRIAEGYHRWWAPVLAPSGLAFLDELDELGAAAERILDIGAGTGTLALGALERWPGANVDAIDASGEMLAVAARESERHSHPTARTRLRLTRAFADELPFEDETFDLAISAFVLQLVPNRYRALREAHRVLRPGGTMAYVTWLETDRWFAPDAAFDRVLEEIGVGAREPDGRCGDLPSVDAAAAQLRRAGFHDVAARGHELSHAFDPRSYLAFVAEFDEEDLFRGFEPDERAHVERRLIEELERLPPDDLVLRLPIVTAVARR